MTFNDVIAQSAGQAGDPGGTYAADALRWLNGVRSYIANEGYWKGALRPSAKITTAAATTTGLYALTDTDTAVNYSFINGDFMFDETNKQTVPHESHGNLRAADQDKTTTGTPSWWGDAGIDSNGVHNVYLWPIPDGTYVITFLGYVELTDISDSQLGLSVDPYLGNISEWASTFFAGLRYYHDLDDNEADTRVSENALRRQIIGRKKRNRISPTSRMSSAIVNTRDPGHTIGRLDPSVYDNSQRWP